MEHEYDSATLVRHDKENYENARVARDIEPLLGRLKPGESEFSREEFRAVVKFLTDDARERQHAFKSGRFVLGKMVIWRAA